MSRYYCSIAVRGPWRLFLGFGIYPIAERDIRERIVKAGYDSHHPSRIELPVYALVLGEKPSPFTGLLHLVVVHQRRVD